MNAVVPAGPAVLSAIAIILAEVRAATISIFSAIRVALVLSIAIANPLDMFRAAGVWNSRVGIEFDDIAAKLDDALNKAGEGWTATDFEALEAKIKDAIKMLKTAQSGAGMISGALNAVAAAYMAFWAFAAQVAFVIVVLAIKVAAARATLVAAAPAQAAAEAVVNGLATALDAFAAKLAAVAGAAAALAGAVTLAGLSGPMVSPVPGQTAKLTQLKIEWAPPNEWISPVRQEPQPYPSNP